MRFARRSLETDVVGSVGYAFSEDASSGDRVYAGRGALQNGMLSV